MSLDNLLSQSESPGVTLNRILTYWEYWTPLKAGFAFKDAVINMQKMLIQMKIHPLCI